MQIHRVALLLLCFPADLDAGRIKNQRGAGELESWNSTSSPEHACKVIENERSLKYGIKGSYKVKSCKLHCKFHNFMSSIVSEHVIADPEEAEGGGHCKCYTSPRFWESHGLDKKFWFEFRLHGGIGCSKKDCKDVFLTWGNMFNKKKAYPGDNERMPVDKYMESQEGYTFECDQTAAEGLILPSPGSKILELRLQIEQCTDPEEKLRLEQLLAELTADKAVEVFAYALDEDWGPEREVDETSGEEHEQHHTFFLKPCKSTTGREVTDLKEIYEQCGQPEMGVSMKSGTLRVIYDIDGSWGPERECEPTSTECMTIKSKAMDEGIRGEILSFRLKPCKSEHTGEEVTELWQIFEEKGCGVPTTKLDTDGLSTLLPVKMDVSSVYDEAAPEADLEYPCPS